MAPIWGLDIRWKSTRLTIGRHPDCQIPVKDSGRVSRNHAQIIRQGDAYFIKDLLSRNGTYLNDEQIGDQLHPLKDGDRIRICDLEFRFRLRDPAKETKSPSASTVSLGGEAGDDSSLNRVLRGRRRHRRFEFHRAGGAGRRQRRGRICAGDTQPASADECVDGNHPQPGQGFGPGRRVAEGAEQPVQDLPAGRSRLHRACVAKTAAWCRAGPKLAGPARTKRSGSAGRSCAASWTRKRRFCRTTSPKTIAWT